MSFKKKIVNEKKNYFMQVKLQKNTLRNKKNNVKIKKIYLNFKKSYSRGSGNRNGVRVPWELG